MGDFCVLSNLPFNHHFRTPQAPCKNYVIGSQEESKKKKTLVFVGKNMITAYLTLCFFNFFLHFNVLSLLINTIPSN